MRRLKRPVTEWELNMGRNKVSLPFDPAVFRELLKGRETFTERAQKYGVSKQAVNGWIEAGRIPPRALCELAMDLELSDEDVQRLLKPTLAKNEEKKKWTLTVTLEEC